ncbi:LysR family transcriptional regulator [Phreatobacter sp. AB_2022a]|uniref:LysR family transcriptional regulator n=1 Tax=Phreatobacter sp. AB_2022a TaxID=3003134 RepID=UPI0022870568|nr:LysR family transcriptional regulator [Phreatobacter sp. AB_2022a]MCZ0734383.1 LysR family transcriptional regulator [Phreatobacter sp. AB_2022a]
MNTRFLEAFVWVARLGSFRGAADRLNLTQAAISSRIASLEEDFGQKLFDRDPRELKLTAAGRVLLPYAERMLEIGRDMQTAVRTGSELTGTLRIGVVETIVHTWLIDFLDELKRRHGGLEIQLTAEPTHRLHEDLRRGQTDVAIQTDAILDESVRNREIGLMPMGWVGPGGGQAGRRVLTLAELAEQPLIAMTRGSQPHLALLDTCRREDVTPKTIHCISSIAAIIRLATAGFGAAVLPLAAIREELADGRLAIIPCSANLGPLRLVVSHRIDPTNRASEVVAALAYETALAFAERVGAPMAVPPTGG